MTGAAGLGQGEENLNVWAGLVLHIPQSARWPSPAVPVIPQSFPSLHAGQGPVALHGAGRDLPSPSWDVQLSLSLYLHPCPQIRGTDISGTASRKFGMQNIGPGHDGIILSQPLNRSVALLNSPRRTIPVPLSASSTAFPYRTIKSRGKGTCANLLIQFQG